MVVIVTNCVGVAVCSGVASNTHAVAVHSRVVVTWIHVCKSMRVTDGCRMSVTGNVHERRRRLGLSICFRYYYFYFSPPCTFPIVGT